MNHKRELKKGQKIKPIVVVISVVVALGIIFGVLYFTGVFNRHGRLFGNYQGRAMMNLQLNESQISEVNSFFASNPSLTEMQNYCKENKNLCFYYCRNNKDADFCKSLMNFGKNQTWQSPGAPVQ